MTSLDRYDVPLMIGVALMFLGPEFKNADAGMAASVLGTVVLVGSHTFMRVFKP